MIEIEAPDGSIVEFPDGTPDDTIKSVMQKNYGGGQQAQSVPQSSLRAATEGSYSGMMGGFDDEIGAAMLSPIEATKNWVQGKGFSIPESYRTLQQRMDADKASMRENNPIASTVGNVAGGLATASGISRNIGTMAGRGLLPAMGEGAAYGAVYGAGESNPGERLQGAATGAATGAITAGVADRVGGAIANRMAARQAKNLAPAPSLDDVSTQARQLYDGARAAGVKVKPSAVKKLQGNMRIAAGRLNTNLRPRTAGVVDDIDAIKGSIDLEQLDELRQSIGQAMKRAEPQDVRTLQLMKNQIDAFTDNVKPGDVTGDIRGFKYLEDARGLWAKKAKSEIITDLLRDAELDTSQYTQSGFANTITKQFRKLAKNKKAMKGFSAEERKAIEQLAMGKQSSVAMKFLAKFAPRGVVSTILGMSPSLYNPAALALPLAGHMAGKGVDKAAQQAVQNLQGNVLRGSFPQVPKIANPGSKYVPLLSGTTAQQVQQRF